MINPVSARILKMLGMGFLAWLIPFVMAHALYTVELYNPEVFPFAILGISMLTSIACLAIYLPSSYVDPRLEGFIAGFVWMIIIVGTNILLLLHHGELTPLSYLLREGWMYIYLPIIGIPLGFIAHKVCDRVIVRDKAPPEFHIRG